MYVIPPYSTDSMHCSSLPCTKSHHPLASTLGAAVRSSNICLSHFQTVSQQCFVQCSITWGQDGRPPTIEGGTYLCGTAQAVPLFKVGRLSRPTFLGKNVHAFRNFCRKSMGKPIFFALASLMINFYAMQTLRVVGDIVHLHLSLL